jgi:membrane fusion protein (multidrug efflux system)
MTDESSQTRNPPDEDARKKAVATSAVSQSQPTPPTAGAPPSSGRSIPKWLIPSVIFALAILLFVLIQSSWENWESIGAVKTDDAYVRADIAPLSTKVVGVVKLTNVSDFQTVKAGQLLVELKNDEYKARVEQAEQAIRQAEVKLADMKTRKEQQDAKVTDAKAALAMAHNGVDQAKDNVRVAQASIEESNAATSAARAGIAQTEAAVRAAEADLTKSSLERKRQEALLAQESATKQKVEQIADETDRDVANLEAQRAAHEKAHSELIARLAQVTKAKQQLLTSHSENEKALQGVVSREAELLAQRKQRELLDGEEEELKADLAAKKAGLTAALVDLDYTMVKAPQGGTVGELKVKPGQLVSAGTNVITLVSSVPWVIANYREVQLAHVRPGDKATVQVDVFSGKRFRGHVESIAPASGAQFSLLPPDNATGNFTKVTQRIPVKIVFDENPDTLALLRPGMSVISTIHTR